MALMKPASWIIREKASKAVIAETFNPALVEALNTEKYEAVPILEYLQSLNEIVKLARDVRDNQGAYAEQADAALAKYEATQ